MLEVSIRPSNQMVCQIATIEKFRGQWSRLSQNSLLASSENQTTAMLQALSATSLLDESCPASANHQLTNLLAKQEKLATLEELQKSLREIPICANYISASLSDTEICTADYRHLHSLITSGGQEPSALRTQPYKFSSRDGELIFLTTASFLLESRLSEILDWTQSALDDGEIHPLLVLGLSHLLLLQLAPFEKFSHSTAVLFIWKQLLNFGYDFLRYCPPSTVFAEQSEQYYASLRQAEKTAGSSWSTTNHWLEFFLSALEQCCRTLQERSKSLDKNSRLTPVQQDIVEVVRSHGSASRDLIVSSTGINTSTVKYNLSLLAAHGVLRRSGGGRSTSYTAI